MTPSKRASKLRTLSNELFDVRIIGLGDSGQKHRQVFEIRFRGDNSLLLELDGKLIRAELCLEQANAQVPIITKVTLDDEQVDEVIDNLFNWCYKENRDDRD